MSLSEIKSFSFFEHVPHFVLFASLFVCLFFPYQTSRLQEYSLFNTRDLNEIFSVCIFFLSTIIWILSCISVQTSTQSHSSNNNDSVLCWLLFSEMTYQKWIVLIAFLTLFSFLAEVKSSPTCLEEVVQQLEETLTSVENFTYAGKSSSCPVKVKRRLDKQLPLSVFLHI